MKSLQKSVTKCIWTCSSQDPYNQENIFRKTGEQDCAEHTNTYVQYESRDSIAGAPLPLQILFSIFQAVSHRILTAEGRFLWICSEKSDVGMHFCPSTSSLYSPISIDPQTLHIHLINFFLICKANARTKLAKTGERSTLFQISVYLCCSVVILVVPCTVCVQTCTVLLPLGDNPIAVNKYIISNFHVACSLCLRTSTCL